MKAEASEKEMKRQSGNGQGRALEQMGLAPPPGLYPDLKSVKPPPYVPQQDLQQGSVIESEDEGREGLRIVIKGTMNVHGEVTSPIAERTRDREDKKSAA